MSSVVVLPEARAAARAAQSTGVPFGRLLRVEWRKQLDTRAGRWLLITIAAVTAVLLAIQAVWGSSEITFEILLGVTASPLSLLLPVVGILAATQEWSQRTGLVMFVLEPRRVRVGVAKLVAALLTGAVAVVVAVALTAATYALLVAFRDVDPQWSVDSVLVSGFGLSIMLAMVQGVAFGLVLQNTPAAIVTYFVLPTVFAFGGAISAFADVWPWLDLNSAMSPLFMGDALVGTDWAHLGTASAIWVVAPLVAGLVRLNRSEIKSA
ncbi:hypothetical protein Xcel_0762 [Xylanimonas cellulosilytica DSM 15894]|uniref:Uncharacterized protein n=1 Tax=Xylanimonas cellulosilytica (strain DSM 15894 / JCM 12276 / CECT 5975 / KCTC 9989 / LMG 20990 / NBRC 107835 / XIL07) TaxID=446471 RepID=D1BXJ1_XYLCX|nr:ABC transporter permease [Xylanimonas cellulosilytica]ACZ29801.1 hypothetical protein Xcel_0762 [Xylanimonas cellulosilytica DSM 15894]